MMTEEKNKKLIYRLRSLDKLLYGDYQELEKQTVYFAPFSELNDPMEGIVDMVWLGDSVVWENLFRHYLLCMEHKVSLATLYKPEESEQFFKWSFPIFVCEEALPTELYKRRFKIIKDRFFSYELVIALIDYLGNKKLPLRKNQLSAILSLISDIALESILFGHDDSGLQPQPFWDILRDTVNEVNSLNRHVEVIKMADSIPEENINALLTVAGRKIDELNLRHYCTMDDDINKINWFYFRSGFLQEYLEQIPQLVYPNWYSASFLSKFPANSVLWGHYGDSHKGVCLIFKTDRKDCEKDFNISLTPPKEINYSSKLQIKDIIYSDERESEVEFFKRLWTQPARIIYKEWYIDKNGHKSSYINEMNPTEELRLAYWDKLDIIQTTKTTNWSYEHESRILINGGFYDLSKAENRTFKYNFNDLEGIIFGIKTPMREKVKIIKIIARKCKENKRNDFKFYQSRYDDGNSTVVCDELSLLKFSE